MLLRYYGEKTPGPMLQVCRLIGGSDRGQYVHHTWPCLPHLATSWTSTDSCWLMLADYGLPCASDSGADTFLNGEECLIAR